MMKQSKALEELIKAKLSEIYKIDDIGLETTSEETGALVRIIVDHLEIDGVFINELRDAIRYLAKDGADYVTVTNRAGQEQVDDLLEEGWTEERALAHYSVDRATHALMFLLGAAG